MDLKLGDIVVFKAEPDEWLSKCIAFLTDSDTSHAAMLYQEDAIMEMGSSGLVISNVGIREGEKVYVMRLENEPDPQPLLDVATAYHQSGVRYDFAGLVLLAGLFIYRKIQPNKALMIIGSKLLMHVILKLDQMIQDAIAHPTEEAMVCSQFVCQVYWDCGKDYHIDVDYQYNRQDKLDTEAELGKSNTGICLAEMLHGYTFENDFVASMGDSLAEKSEAEIAEEFYYALTDTASYDVQNDAVTAIQQDQQMKQALHLSQEFIKKITQLLKEIKADVPIDALFVTPGDFVNHSRNLDLIKLVDLARMT